MLTVETFKTSYLYKRKSIYYIRIQRPLLVFSLRTNSNFIARNRLQAFLVLLPLFKQGIVDKKQIKKLVRMDIDPVKLANQIIKDIGLSPKNSNHSIDYYADCCFGDAHAEKVLDDNPELLYALSYLSNDYRELYYNSTNYNESLNREFDKVGAILASALARDFIRESELKTLFSVNQTQNIEPSKLGSEAFKAFIDDNISGHTPLSPDRVKKLREAICEFIFVCGDKPLTEYVKNDAKSFIDALYLMPTSRVRYHKQKDLETLIEEEHPTRAYSTVNKYFQRINQFFKWSKQNDLIRDNIFEGLTLKKSTPKHYAAFTDNDICKIQSALNKLEGWRRWIPTIAIYTGARSNEIGQLKYKDVMKDDDTNRYYLIITDHGEGQSIKSESARRRVPLNSKLNDWVSSLDFTGDENRSLWPDLHPTDGYYSNTIGRWFRDSFMRKLNIERQDDEGRRKVFHSFRTTFITNAVQNNVDLTLMHCAVGHKDKNLGESITYLRVMDIKIKALLPIIDWQE
jgi:integrase